MFPMSITVLVGWHPVVELLCISVTIIHLSFSLPHERPFHAVIISACWTSFMNHCAISDGHPARYAYQTAHSIIFVKGLSVCAMNGNRSFNNTFANIRS